MYIYMHVDSDDCLPWWWTRDKIMIVWGKDDGMTKPAQPGVVWHRGHLLFKIKVMLMPFQTYSKYLQNYYTSKERMHIIYNHIFGQQIVKEITSD